MEAIQRFLRYESASSSLAFRERLYTQAEDESIIRDCLALANAETGGARLLILGVRDVPGGEREFLGVDRIGLVELKQRMEMLVARHIEPEIKLVIRAADIDGKRIGIVHLSGCDDPPYLLREAFGDKLPAGMGLVRRGTSTLPLLRADLASLFARESEALAQALQVRVGFARDKLSQEMTLPVLPVRQLPSELAAQRLRSMIEAKKDREAMLNRTGTHISRIMHARVWRAETPFEALTDESLAQRLEHTSEDYRDADAFYEYEVCAHKLQLGVRNTGATELHHVRLEVVVPQLEGVGITDRIYREDGDNATTGSYPLVTRSGRTIRLESEIGTLAEGESADVFREPPRLWLREPAAGKSLPLDYTLTADELPEPIRDTLVLHIAPADT